MLPTASDASASQSTPLVSERTAIYWLYKRFLESLSVIRHVENSEHYYGDMSGSDIVFLIGTSTLRQWCVSSAIYFSTLSVLFQFRIFLCAAFLLFEHIRRPWISSLRLPLGIEEGLWTGKQLSFETLKQWKPIARSLQLRYGYHLRWYATVCRVR